MTWFEFDKEFALMRIRKRKKRRRQEAATPPRHQQAGEEDFELVKVKGSGRLITSGKYCKSEERR